MRAASAPRPRFPLWPWALLAASAIIYTIFIARFTATWAGGADSSGYLNSARLLLEGKIREPVAILPGYEPPLGNPHHYQPLGYLAEINEDGAWMVPTYPLGLPLHYAAASFFVGLGQAPALINVLTGLISAWVLALFARRIGLSSGWAVGAVLVLCSCPLFLCYLLQPMSDSLALMWSLIAVYLGWRSREKWPWAIGAGVAVAISVFVRPTGILIVPAVALAMGFNGRAWLACGIAGLPPAVFLLVYNDTLYGDPFKTGYGNIGSSFQLDYASLSLPHIARWLPVVLSPIVMVLAGFGVWSLRKKKQLLAVLLVWITAIVGCYLFYYHTHETWWYLRFILPSFPAIILLAMSGGQALLEKVSSPHVQTRWLVVILTSIVAWEVWWVRNLHVTSVKTEERTYPTVTTWMNEHLPANAIIFQMQTSGASQFYSRFTSLRYDLMTREQLLAVTQIAVAAQRPVYAVLYPYEKEDMERRNIGTWEKISEQRLATIWKLIGPPVSTPQS